ncbi:RsmD family RNA methyltransferase [uncultured Mucilaginibacter sp.]|uniref:RsmD family RNA methyltransferase n=1 Tax=uncultured Mucilaginibacter sp. TaxID=797541 RepID=UPI002617CE7C|nr:RsmD family RNA methyltransferase [uncultured Mucilaginibacter sp.]
MRIIGGRLKGLRLNPPNNLPVRPTTDLAKEALFNILNNQLDFEGLKVLDLFSGTGNIAMEFASRNAEKVVAVDRAALCIFYIKDMAAKHKLPEIAVFKADVFKFLEMETERYDLIFADPPYNLDKIPQLPNAVFTKHLLVPDGLLIIEHPAYQNLSNQPNFSEKRVYGNTAFSFFKG